MFKKMIIAVAILMAFASVGYCAANNWGQTDRDPLLNLVLPSYLQAIGTPIAAGVSMTTTDVAVPVTYSFVRKEIGSSGAEAGTLANGSKGQILSILITGVGSGTFVLTPTTCTGFSALTFNAEADQATLLYVNDSVGWVLIAQNSITITKKA